jgi:hypothetical protein
MSAFGWQRAVIDSKNETAQGDRGRPRNSVRQRLLVPSGTTLNKRAA